MIAVALLPIALLGKRNEHISVDVFTNLMPGWIRRACAIFATVLGMAYMFVFTWQSWISADRRTTQGEVLEISGGYMIVWPARWFLPIAGASLFLVFVLRLIRQILSEDDEPRIHDA
jgi:TRAP-type C4-dicarboxylate transport system permease small subunit